MDSSRSISAASFSTAWGSAQVWIRQRRRLVVAVLVGIAVVSGLSAVRPRPLATRAVWVAARDLSGGAPLAGGDVAIERLPVADVPAGAVPPATSVSGRLLAAPLRRGEPLTDVALLSPSLLTALDLPDDVAVPVRIADGPAALALVHAGDRVDVLAATSADAAEADSAGAGTIVRDVRVIATPERSAAADGSDDGSDLAGLIIVAASHHQALALAQAASDTQLSVAVRRPD